MARPSRPRAHRRDERVDGRQRAHRCKSRARDPAFCMCFMFCVHTEYTFTVLERAESWNEFDIESVLPRLIPSTRWVDALDGCKLYRYRAMTMPS